MNIVLHLLFSFFLHFNWIEMKSLLKNLKASTEQTLYIERSNITDLCDLWIQVIQGGLAMTSKSGREETKELHWHEGTRRAQRKKISFPELEQDTGGEKQKQQQQQQQQIAITYLRQWKFHLKGIHNFTDSPNICPPVYLKRQISCTPEEKNQTHQTDWMSCLLCP